MSEEQNRNNMKIQKWGGACKGNHLSVPDAVRSQRHSPLGNKLCARGTRLVQWRQEEPRRRGKGGGELKPGSTGGKAFLWALLKTVLPHHNGQEGRKSGVGRVDWCWVESK